MNEKLSCIGMIFTKEIIDYFKAFNLLFVDSNKTWFVGYRPLKEEWIKNYSSIEALKDYEYKQKI